MLEAGTLTREIDYAGSKIGYHRKELDAQNSLYWAVITVGNSTQVRLELDNRFPEFGIVGDNELLISQDGTKDLWSTQKGEDQVVGRLPSEFIKESNTKGERIGIVLSNAFWQYGEVIVNDGRIHSLPNDKHIPPKLEVIVKNEATLRWESRSVNTQNGVLVDEDALENISIGYSASPLIRDSEAVEMSELASNLRIRADVRNLLDVGYRVDFETPSDRNMFFSLIRKFLPTDEEGIRKIMGGNSEYSEAAEEMSEDEANALESIILRNLSDKYTFDRMSKTLTVNECPPYNRLPCYGYGYNNEGELVIVQVDGRRPGAPGATIMELTEIMLNAGIVYGALGAAGNDVIILNEKQEVMNALAYLKGESFISRPAPSMVIIGGIPDKTEMV